MTMDNTGYIALSHQMALQRQMDVIAHNIANTSTTGYKANQTLFEQFLMKAGPQRELSYVQDFGVLINFREGPIERTGNPLDIGLQGDGFLVAQTATGDLAYTRGGHLTINAQGNLASAEGDAILDENRRPILADPSLGPLIVNGDGSLTVGGRPPVRLALVTFDNLQTLRRRGGGYFTTDSPEQVAPKARTLQGMLERSNVEPVIELAAMIETSRAYQASNKLIETEHELQRKMAERLPQLRG